MRRRFLKSQTSLPYMAIEALEYITVNLPGKIEYAFNGGNTWEEGNNGTTLYLQKGAMVSFRNMEYRTQSSYSFKIRGSCHLVGNCMSLIPDGKMYEYAFAKLFKDCAGIISVSDGFLPATTLANSCYSNMFYGCTSLTVAPELPATTLASNCYGSMFYGCTSLTVAPALPATTLASNCYGSMFQGCTSLTTAPELPATTLDNSCYSSMFEDCSRLTTAPELPATTLVVNCYYNMFNGCTKLNYIKMLATDISASHCLFWWVKNVATTGTFVKNPAMNSLPTGTDGIPSRWTVQNATS